MLEANTNSPRSYDVLDLGFLVVPNNLVLVENKDEDTVDEKEVSKSTEVEKQVMRLVPALLVREIFFMSLISFDVHNIIDIFLSFKLS